MWKRGWREQVWAELERPWDLIVIGGGITGAGILHQAALAGLRALLVEARDFAYGTSSRSSKLVHGGLRYLRHAQVRLTFQSVRERDRLLRDAAGLVKPLGFLMANYQRDRPPGWVYGLGLTLYDLLALKWQHRHYRAPEIQALCPPIRREGLQGGYVYQDACTDDARLVLRVLAEAQRAGGAALNYTPAVELLRDRRGQVCGVILRDDSGLYSESARFAEARAAVVVNATGAWADQMRAAVGGRARLRRLRGSHLIFPRSALPVEQAVSFLHPADRRPVFVIPWEGVSLVGTTDVDHSAPLEAEPTISPTECEYLLTALDYAFPTLGLCADQVQATYAGVRAVVNTGQANPSAESREHALWNEAGLLTITGGKLTTYRLMAEAALREVRRGLQRRPLGAGPLPCPAPAAPGLPPAGSLDPAMCQRLAVRHGPNAAELIAAAAPGELAAPGDSPYCLAEVRWAARTEGVVHLDDLLLRRVRMGLLCPQGGLTSLEAIRGAAQAELGWSDDRWRAETAAYAALWRGCYAGTAAHAAAFQPSL